MEVLGGEGIAARLDNDLDELTPSVVHVSCGCIDHGFVAPALKLAVLTETDLTGQKASGREGARMPARRRKTIDPLTLEAGDYVVHEQHGVGRYIEMVQRTVQGATREYLVVEYAPPSAASPATGSTSPPTSSSRSPSTSAARRPPCTGSAAPTGPRPRRAPRRPSRRSPPT